MPDSYIRLDNLFFVPVIRQRLNFAVLVRRAVHDLEQAGRAASRLQRPLPLDGRDLIAVALPESVRAHVEESIRDFPKVSLVIATLSRADHREVFPVTPCDGIIEAMRIADERMVPLRCIDREVPPGHLGGRTCVSDPDWPDDTLALQVGVDEYRKLILGHSSQPPARQEPVDTWREIHMAETLRRLQPRYRRLLVVCDFANVSAIIRLLKRKSQGLDASEQAFGTLRYEIATPGLNVLLKYLDDFPKLVELYEEERAWGRGKEFNKKAVLLQTIHELEQGGAGARFSPRQHIAFAEFLENLLRFERRITPLPLTIFDACRASFDKGFAERVFSHLTGYADQVKVERVGRADATGESLYTIEEARQTKRPVYVGRSCNPNLSYYKVVKPPQPPGDDGTSTGDKYYCWPPIATFVNEIRKKAGLLALLEEREVKVSPFRGSLDGGVDARRTLRSFLSNTPTLYVKRRRPKASNKNYSREPVVSVLDATDAQRFAFSSTNHDNTYMTELKVYRNRNSKDSIYQSDDGRHAIYHYDVIGFVTFCDLNTGLKDLREELGEEFEQRIPNHKQFRHPKGCVHQDFEGQLNSGYAWWEIAMLTALKHAKEAIVCILPEGFRLPPRVVAHPLAQGKRFVCISLHRFTKAERGKLVSDFLIRRPKLKDDERIGDKYDHLVKPYWPD